MADTFEITGTPGEWRLVRRRAKDDGKRNVAGPWITREEADAQLAAAEKRQKAYLAEVATLEATEPQPEPEPEPEPGTRTNPWA
jgi:hypothetical protein